MTSKPKNQNEEQDNEQPHEAMYRIYKFLYYILCIMGTAALLLMIDVAWNNDYSMRNTIGEIALAGMGILIVERIMDYKLKKWGVII